MSDDRPPQTKYPVLSARVIRLDLSARCHNLVIALNLPTVRHVRSTPDAVFLKAGSFGKDSLEELRRVTGPYDPSIVPPSTSFVHELVQYGEPDYGGMLTFQRKYISDLHKEIARLRRQLKRLRKKPRQDEGSGEAK